MPNKRTRCLPNFTVSPSETANPCEVPVPLVSESVWANADTAAVQSTISANQTFTCPLRHVRYGFTMPEVKPRAPSQTYNELTIGVPATTS
jgi:hypothetical protein